MTTSIGQNIKRLRRERDITQEALAEYLGITAQAVSGWECDRNMPDIMQLPLLANIFGVPTDEILGVNVGAREANIDEICKKAEKANADGFRDEAVRILRKGLLEYPNAYEIMSLLAKDLYLAGQSEEALDLSQKIMQDCTNINVRAETTSLLCSLYSHMGQKKKAIETAMTLPEVSRNDLLPYLYEGEQLTEFYRKNTLDLFGDALHQTGQLAFCRDDEGKPVYTADEQLTIQKKIIAVFEILMEDGDYNFFAQFMESAYRQSARLYAEKKDAENTLACLRKMVEFVRMFVQYPADATQTSLLFRGVKYGGWVKNTPEAEKEMVEDIHEFISDTRFDFVRATGELEKIIRLLKTNA
ncbi:MAG: helix-turn-helix transcriptional regulator [Clostridia bacterium]|nr:helix-turn-helix transcriptional regulator [Clostridia bacterium]